MTVDKLYKYELGLLSLLVLVLPSLEAPKTFFWLSYLCIYIIRRYKNGSLSLLHEKTVNIAVTLYLTVAIISTLTNWPINNGCKGFRDELRFLSMFLCLYNGGYSASEYRRIALLIIAGSLAGLVYGLADFLLGIRTDFQFHSAGILTQSSIYLGIAIILNVGLILNPEDDTPKLRTLLKMALFIQTVALVYIGSRGSMLAVMLTLVFLALIKMHISTLITWLSVITVLVVIAAGLIQLFPDNKFSRDLSSQYSIERTQESDSERIGAWKVALAKLSEGKDLVWGIGPRNYISIYEMNFVQKNKELSQLKKFDHAHNLFLTQLIEQGIAGLLAMTFFLLLVLKEIITAWRKQTSHPIGWAWYGGIGGLSIPVIAGLFNTPLYKEHAILAMVVIGMMFAMTKKTSKISH